VIVGGHGPWFCVPGHHGLQMRPLAVVPHICGGLLDIGLGVLKIASACATVCASERCM